MMGVYCARVRVPMLVVKLCYEATAYVRTKCCAVTCMQFETEQKFVVEKHSVRQRSSNSSRMFAYSRLLLLLLAVLLHNKLIDCGCMTTTGMTAAVKTACVIAHAL
jgi:hypothetical protein